MKFETIDFHTHPFPSRKYNICNHIDWCNMSAENSEKTMQGLGVSKICGSVIRVGELKENETWWDRVRECNDAALELKKQYGDFYVPGFHVHPDYVAESIAEIDRMRAQGIRLIGELVPYLMGWRHYHGNGMDEILEYAAEKNMIVSIHAMENDDMDEMVKAHPNTVIVAAHPNEYDDFMRHIARMKMSKNYYLDLSGYGLFRHGMLRRAIDEVGAERILYGSDFPTCNPAMYLGGVVLDELVTDEEKKLILAGNAKRLLEL